MLDVFTIYITLIIVCFCALLYSNFLRVSNDLKILHERIYLKCRTLDLLKNSKHFPGYVRNRSKREYFNFDFFEELRLTTMLEI